MMAFKRNKYLEINLTREVTYILSCQTLLERNEGKTYKCKDSPYPWTGRFKFIKMSVHEICRPTAVPIKMTMAILQK